MERINQKTNIILVIALAVVVFLSRVPFLADGFGSYPDTWRVANTARSIALTHQYTYSRPPGHPLQELSYSLIWNASPAVYNAITALFSAGAFIVFALILARIDRKKAIMGALALSFIPVVYIASTNSEDCIWALFFILWSFYLTMKNKFAAAGIILGLAIGCRITSAAMILPVGVLAYYQNAKWVRSFVTYAALAVGVGLITYIPVIYAYKLSFFTFPEHGYLPILTVLKNASIDVWGFLGSFAVITFAILIGIKLRKVENLFKDRDPVFLASCTAVFIFVIMFIRLPHQPLYLIPAIPFVIILMSKVLDHRWFSVLCILLILSSFILTLNRRQFSLAGPIFEDRQTRIKAMQFTESVIEQAVQLSKDSIVVSGYYLPELTWYLNKNPIEGVQFTYLLTADELETTLKNHKNQLYYLPLIDEFNQRIYGANPADYGGKPLLTNDQP